MNSGGDVPQDLDCMIFKPQSHQEKRKREEKVEVFQSKASHWQKQSTLSQS
jgi:hypothetical protein